MVYFKGYDGDVWYCVSLVIRLWFICRDVERRARWVFFISKFISEFWFRVGSDRIIYGVREGGDAVEGGWGS